VRQPEGRGGAANSVVLRARPAQLVELPIPAEITAPSRTPGVVRYAPAVSLLTDLDAFFTDHLRCGDLDAGVDGPFVWMACDCGASSGASMARCVDVGR
jgi:hypothetical protein